MFRTGHFDAVINLVTRGDKIFHGKDILSVFGRGHSIAVIKSGLIGVQNISGKVILHVFDRGILLQ